MEKIAVIELNPNFVRMQQVEIEKNKFYSVYNEITTPIDLMKNFEPDCFVKAHAINEILETLRVYKAMVDKEEITDTICFAHNILSKAKNCEGILNEITNASTFKFEILDPNKELSYLYTAVINSFSKPKGLIMNVGDYETSFLIYNRRNVLTTHIIPFGRINLYNKFENEEDKYAKMQEFIKEQIPKSLWNFPEFETDWEVIGTGSLFRNLGVLSRRATKYPLEIEHNYSMTEADSKKVFEAVKGLETNRATKIKGLTNVESMYFPAGLTIVNAFLEVCPIKRFAISRTDKVDGMLFNYALPLTLEKPLADALGYSLLVSSEMFDRKDNSPQIYRLSLTLFKLFKVIHKLNRSFVKVLRIASYLSESGKRISYQDRVRASFPVIENTTLYGVSHSEIILACFVSKLRDMDNFSMAEWVKYKDIVGDVDLEIVKRLAVIIKIAEALDITGFSVVQDVDCDILGDSFILKLVTEGNSSLEIKHAKQCITDFKKAYGKGLEFM